MFILSVKMPHESYISIPIASPRDPFGLFKLNVMDLSPARPLPLPTFPVPSEGTGLPSSVLPSPSS